jgi:hypothetical protein
LSRHVCHAGYVCFRSGCAAPRAVLLCVCVCVCVCLCVCVCGCVGVCGVSWRPLWRGTAALRCAVLARSPQPTAVWLFRLYVLCAHVCCLHVCCVCVCVVPYCALVRGVCAAGPHIPSGWPVVLCWLGPPPPQPLAHLPAHPALPLLYAHCRASVLPALASLRPDAQGTLGAVAEGEAAAAAARALVAQAPGLLAGPVDAGGWAVGRGVICRDRQTYQDSSKSSIALYCSSTVGRQSTPQQITAGHSMPQHATACHLTGALEYLASWRGPPTPAAGRWVGGSSAGIGKHTRIH